MDSKEELVADIDKRKIRNVVRMICAEKRMITLLKNVKIWKQFEEKVIKFVDVGAPHLWGHLKDVVL